MKNKIGIDIGGSKIRAVIWNGKRVLAARQIKTPKSLSDFKKEIIKLTTWQLNCQVGIGAAGIVSDTKIVRSPNIKYLKNFDFSSLGIPTAKLKLDNDARCFARSVVGNAGGRFSKNHTILTITLGTGIGRAIAKNDKILIIKKFEYPEKWENEYQKMRGKPKKNMDDKFAIFLAEKILLMAKPYNLDALVFGGGVTDRNGFALKIRKAFKQRGMNFNISVSKLGKNAVAVGAAMQ